MGVDNKIRYGCQVTPEIVSEVAEGAVREAVHNTHAFRKNAGPRDLFAMLILSADMEGWDFEGELREGRKIARRPELYLGLPKATKRGNPGDYVKDAVQAVRGDAAAIKKLISRMPGGFNRFVLFNMLKEAEEECQPTD